MNVLRPGQALHVRVQRDDVESDHVVEPQLQRVELAGMCRPALGVGGEYYDFVAVSDGVSEAMNVEEEEYAPPPWSATSSTTWTPSWGRRSSTTTSR